MCIPRVRSLPQNDEETVKRAERNVGVLCVTDAYEPGSVVKPIVAVLRNLYRSDFRRAIILSVDGDSLERKVRLLCTQCAVWPDVLSLRTVFPMRGYNSPQRAVDADCSKDGKKIIFADRAFSIFGNKNWYRSSQ